MDSALEEAQLRPYDEVPDGTRHEHLTRTRQRSDPSADVHAHPGDVIVRQLNLSGVDACTYFDAEPTRPIADLARTADRSRRAVEGGQEAIPHRLDLSSLIHP